MTGVKANYDAQVSAGALNADVAQAEAVALLDDLAGKLHGYALPSKPSGLTRLFSRAAPQIEAPQGLYIWGGVGRGKSMLMDLFFETAQVEKKKRVHFHAFMQSIHDRLTQARATGIEDPLQVVAGQVVAEAHLLCFDELQITDITDAMIVGRLFERLFAEGVVIVTTSNRVPGDLYKDGLNRKLFLPFIDLISEKLKVHHLDGEQDHRRRQLAGRDLFFSPLSDATRADVDGLFAELTSSEPAPLVIENKGRLIELPQFANGVARVPFEALCAQPLGPSDFLAIAGAVTVMILDDIPQLGRARANEAKRFVTLIDALYEADITLIARAAVEPEVLYEKGDGAFEFERTVSRLSEMRFAQTPQT